MENLCRTHSKYFQWAQTKRNKCFESSIPLLAGFGTTLEQLEHLIQYHVTIPLEPKEDIQWKWFLIAIFLTEGIYAFFKKNMYGRTNYANFDSSSLKPISAFYSFFVTKTGLISSAIFFCKVLICLPHFILSFIALYIYI